MLIFLDNKQEVIKRMPNNRISSLVQYKTITSDKKELMNHTLNATIIYDKTVEKLARFMVIKDDEEFSVFRITKITGDKVLNIEGVDFAPDELNNYIVKDIRPQNRHILEVLEQILGSAEATEWTIDNNSSAVITDNFYYVSVKEALKKLQEHGVEFTFSCEIDTNGITKKTIHCHDQIGKETATRFTYGSKALSVVKTVERTNIATSIIGRGRGEEVGDGYGRRIEFADVVWKKSNGDPLDKPKGQIFLEDPEATAVDGIPTKNGMRKREIVLVFDDCEDPNELLKLTYDALMEYKRPLEQFEADVTESNDHIGDTVTIHRHDRDYHYKARIFGIERDLVHNKVKASFGDNLVSNRTSSAVNTLNSIKDMEQKKMTFFQSTEISKFQDDIMRGAGKEGGSIYQVNGIEAGVSDSREVYEYVWMNGKNIPSSSHFMTANSEGISFKECKKGQWKTIKDVHNGLSHTAWTIDGTFNANFIGAGKIRADIFETSFNNVGDQLRFIGGAIQAMNGKTKVAEYNKHGMQFFRKNGSTVGTIGTTDSAGNPFPEAVTPTPLTDNSLVIKTDEDGEYILISPKKGKGLVMLGNGNATYFGDLDVQGTLKVKGLPVTPGQGGGPSGPGESTGGIPSELTTEPEKRAWRIYDILLNNKFTKQAACGILGNMQQETGGTFDPDTRQIGGPAYGLVQWDGSAYPLVGPATYDGKQYVQNLFNAAGIKKPVEDLAGQVQLLLWTFTNGQWIGVIEPSSIAAFKQCTDPRLAARAFERNYERPAATHPEREDYAANWYNRFKDLKPSQGTGEAGLAHLESLLGVRIGNGQCYALSAEYSGVLGGCGLGAGTKYGLSHVIGDTVCASNIGSSYDWGAVGWKVIFNPSYDQLVVGSIINWKAGGQVEGWYADSYYGHTGVIRGLDNGRIQTYEQNVTGTAAGMVCTKQDRGYYGSIASICIPPK